MAVKEIGRRRAIAGAVSLLAVPASAQPRVSTALVLAADISGSITQGPFEIQRKGYAEAFTDARVIRAIEDTAHRSIAVCYFEWASGDSQRLLVPWTLVGSIEDGRRIATILGRAPRPFDGATDLRAAITFATDLLESVPFSAIEQVIDVSGDGVPNDDDEGPDAARDHAVGRGITINGLVISNGQVPSPGESPLTDYYEAHVMGGPKAFVVEADCWEAFGAVMVSKLLREIT